MWPPRKANRSPLDVPGVDLRVSRDEIVQFIREGRRPYEPRPQPDEGDSE